jgi:hypothetical protein
MAVALKVGAGNTPRSLASASGKSPLGTSIGLTRRADAEACGMMGDVR